MRPQDDLFRAVNGGWLAKAKIPADRSSYGAFQMLIEQAEKDLRAIIEGSPTAKDNPPGSEKQKIGDMYASYMDEARAEQLGIEPIAEILAAIDRIANKDDLIRILRRVAAHRRGRPAGLLRQHRREEIGPVHSLSRLKAAWGCPIATTIGTPS